MDNLSTFLSRPDARGTVKATDPGAFLQEQLRPLLMELSKKIRPDPPVPDATIRKAEYFWSSKTDFLSVIRLQDFVISDWFPRTPGLYWTGPARDTREYMNNEPGENDPKLGRFLPPRMKMQLIELAGIGCVRLRPRKIDGEYCWLGTAVEGGFCHAGIPLAIPERLLQETGVRWGEKLDIVGRIRFLQDAGLRYVADNVIFNKPLILFVEELRPKQIRSKANPVVLTPVVMFKPEGEPPPTYSSNSIGYTFVHCDASDEKNIDDAVEWIDGYVDRYNGKIITNFDEQHSRLAGAPLSYQRLVAKTYDKKILEHFTGNLTIEHLERLQLQEMHVGHNISVGGNAIIAIDSTLDNVSQTLGSAAGLAPEQKAELDKLVQEMKSELDKLKASHAEEVQEIANSLQKAVTSASKPPEERKKRFLDLSAANLLQAAELVDKAAPTVIHIATRLAQFIHTLPAF